MQGCKPVIQFRPSYILEIVKQQRVYNSMLVSMLACQLKTRFKFEPGHRKILP